MVMMTNSTAPVAIVLQSSAIACITAGELLRHDAGADHRHDENERAERFRRQPARQIELHCSPSPDV